MVILVFGFVIRLGSIGTLQYIEFICVHLFIIGVSTSQGGGLLEKFIVFIPDSYINFLSDEKPTFVHDTYLLCPAPVIEDAGQ